MIQKKYVLSAAMNRDYVKMGNSEIKTIGEYENVVVNDSYCRIGVATLVANEIYRRNILGEVAELGVYKGYFAKYINELFNDRTLYLFDTFQGFVPDELEHDIKKGFLEEKNYFNTVNDFTDTSVEEVLSRMKYPERVIIKKGIFPNTVSEELKNVRYAFVSLDADLYNPIIEGLRYFYPRLSEGGYIMIHDFDNCDGVMKAVYDFEKENGHIAKVPIPDECGTLVVVKEK